MTNTDKMTNRKALQFVLDNCDVPDDVHEKIEAMIAAIDKKSGAERKPSARQVANEELKAAILRQMEVNTLYDIQTMLKTFEGFNDISSQHLSALLKQLVDEGKVVRSVDKRKTYFSLA